MQGPCARIILFLALGLAPLAASAAPQPLRVRVLELWQPRQLEVREGPRVWRLEARGDRALVDGREDQAWSAGGAGQAVRVRMGGRARAYPGRLRLGRPAVRDGALVLVNEMDPADYVPCVVAAESGRALAFPAQRRALGAVVLSVALQRRKPAADWDLRDYTVDQLYEGLPPQWPLWRQWVLGQGLRRLQGLDREALFSASCGGRLDPAEALWGRGSAAPVVACRWEGRDLCRGHAFYRWERTIPFAHLQAALQQALGPARELGRLRDLQPSAWTAGGRVRRFEAVGLRWGVWPQRASVETPALISALGRHGGWNQLPSTALLAWERMGEQVRVRGAGLGHGSGFCQSGAEALAELGWPPERILAHYFPGSTWEPWDGP